ncbi:MAG: hypothetical protein AAGF87_15165 [Bacteroidota bacterium]
MNNIKLVFATAIFVLLYSSCNNDNIAIGSIDPIEDPSAFSRSLLINNAVNIEGDIPELESDFNFDILNAQQSATVSVNNFLFLPFIYNADNDTEGLFLQIDGADNYWRISFESDTLEGRSSRVVSVGIPENVKEGSSIINYKLFGAGGSSSGQMRSLFTEIEQPQSFCMDGTTVGLVEGADGITNKTFKLGMDPGFISIDFNTFVVPDRVDIRYNGQWIRSTGSLLSNSNPQPPIKECSRVTPGDGFLGTQGTFNVFYDPGESDEITVYVSGCLDGGTAWEFEIRECPNDKPILGIHSNVDPENAAFDDGHAWVSLTQNGNTTFYGLWPDMHPAVPDNGNATDVRVNVENGFARYSRFLPIDEQQLEVFNNYIAINHTWQLTNNCSSFAQELFRTVTREDIPADEIIPGSFIETPRKLSEGIIQFESNYPTSSHRPEGVSDDSSSCSFCF